MQVVFRKTALSLGVDLWKRPVRQARPSATHCNTLQHTATHCNIICGKRPARQAICKTLQHTATHCNTLQHSATICKLVFGKRPARPAILRVLETPVCVCDVAILFAYVWHGCSTCVICLTHRFDQTLLNVQHDSCIQTIIENTQSRTCNTCTYAHTGTNTHEFTRKDIPPPPQHTQIYRSP